MSHLFYDDELATAIDGDVDAVDLFAGPGGWSEALAAMGRTDVGVEFDRWACATRRAAGHRTVEVDVSIADPTPFVGIPGLIASPPCQAFSNAGNRHGLRYVEQLIDSIHGRRWHDRCSRDPRVWLVLEVGRWIEALHPRWIALEQVPAVLPLWNAYADMLREMGYSVWVGKLNAADYGCPQIRLRAVLMASLDHEVTPPPPTHSRTGENGLQRYVPMAQALGWGMTARPALTVAPGKDTSGLGGSGARRSLDDERDAGRFVEIRRGGDRIHEGFDADEEPAQAITSRVNRWQVGFPRADDGRGAEPPADGYRARDWRDIDEPAFAVTEKARSWVLAPVPDTVDEFELVEAELDTDDVDGWILTTGMNPDDERSVNDPAPTATTRADQWIIDTRRHWHQNADGSNQTFDAAVQPALTLTSKTGGQWVLNPGKTDTQPNRRHYGLDEPAPTLAFGHDAAAWCFERPATTIAGDSRVFPPGGHIANDGRDNSKMVGRSENTIRLSINDALVLQSFRADYPVCGGRTQQFVQVGNAVPPLLAAAVLSRLITTP